MNICIYTVHLFLYECITCKVRSCLYNYCTFHISYVTTNTQKYKITSMKKIIIGGHPVALVGQAKDFHPNLIWCFPWPCTGQNLLEHPPTHPLQWSAVMSSHEAFMHPTQTSDLVLYDLHIYIYICSQTWLAKWLNQIVLQLEVIWQFSRHYKQCQCQIFMEYTCVYTSFW